MRIFIKISKFLLLTAATVLALVLLVCAVVYVPGIQRLAIGRASAVVEETTGFRLSVERFRLRFPLGVAVRGVTVVSPAGDTLARVGRGRIRVAPTPLLRGRVVVTRFTVDNARASWRDTLSGMTLGGRVERFEAGVAAVDPVARTVRLGSILVDGGGAEISMGGETAPEPPVEEPAPPLDWTISLGTFELRDFALAFDLPPDSLTTPVPSPAAAFDPARIRVEEAGVTVRDINFHKGDISARFEALTLAERSGLRITDGSGEVAMNTDGYSLKNLIVATAGSRIEGSASAGTGIANLDPATPLSVELSARLSTDEAALLSPVPMPAGLSRRTANIDLSLDGTLGEVAIRRAEMRLPPEITLGARGTLRSPADPAALSGSLAVEGVITDADFALDMIADSTLRRRVAVPPVDFSAAADFTPEIYNLTAFTLTAGSGPIEERGRMEGSGSFRPATMSYDTALRLVDFPLGEFLPRDSLGPATVTLRAAGRGLDPLTLETRVSLGIGQLRYGEYELGRVAARLTAAAGNITASIRSRNDLLDTGISLTGTLSPDAAGRPLPLGYVLAASIDSTTVRMGCDTLRIDPATVTARASSTGVEAGVRIGDAAIDFSSPLSPEALMTGATRTGTEIARILTSRSMAVDTLCSSIPRMTLTAHVGRGNFLYGMARELGFDFDTVTARFSNLPGAPLRLDAAALGMSSGGLTLDTLGLRVVEVGDRLRYRLALAGRPESAADFGSIAVSGGLSERSLTSRVVQRGGDGQVGFDFGVRTTLIGERLRAEITSPRPILGYESWTAGSESSHNHDGDSHEGGGETSLDENRFGENSEEALPDIHDLPGWIEYGFDGSLRADLHLESATNAAATATATHTTPSRHIAITSDSLPGIPHGALAVSIGGLDIAPMLDLLPTAPPVGGIFSSELTVGFHSTEEGRNIVAARGELGIEGLSLDSTPLADVGARGGFVAGDDGRMTLGASVDVDGTRALTARGTYDAEAMDFTVAVPGLPLALAQRLLPPETATLSGSIDGSLRITGTPSRPIIAGDVGFTDAAVAVAMVGTTFGISPERITIADERVTLHDFGLTAPGGGRLAVNGSVDIADPVNPLVDMSLSAQNFRFVDSSHRGGSQIYGRGALDGTVTARGTLGSVRVRGNVEMASGTDMVYIVRSTQKVSDQKQHLVRFVSSADSLEAGATPAATPSGPGLDVLVAMGIGEGAKATLSLDERNENRVELVGGGDLTFSMNRQGDTRLAGRYTLSGGNLYYKPPVIDQKIFAVREGSYVEWAGELFSPRVDITATQSMEVRLDYDGGEEKDVAFDISASVAGTLEGLDMKFDLAAPGDIAIQEQLLAMSDEGRMQQALSLLVYEQYTGPGVSSRGLAFDARGQLNDFVSREINQWARNNLRGVDVSMGIDTRDDAAGTRSTDYSYSVSKMLFSDRVKISIGGSVSDRVDSPESAAGSLLEDVTIEYRLTERDNMFLKFYRNNTRASILEGEVTEMGGGVVIRKKMNRPGDLFRRRGATRGPDRNPAKRDEK